MRFNDWIGSTRREAARYVPPESIWKGNAMAIVSGQTQALTSAAEAAAIAPSFHNTQPWHWRIHDGVADLYAEPRRHLPASDPERRMLMLSCGCALHHVSASLAAEGMAIDIHKMPDPASPDHLASVKITGRTPVTPAAIRLVQTMAIRHTDRRPLLEEALTPAALSALRSVVAAFGVGFDVLDRGQVIELAAATARAQSNEVSDDEVRAELHAWTEGAHPAGTGVPASTIPARPLETTVPSRDFGHVGSMPVSSAHDAAASYAILYGVDDDPRAWLTGGEALSALWLTATEWSIAVLPLSAAVESASARHELRRILSNVGYPYIAVRLGIADPNRPTAERTARLPLDEIVDVVTSS
jgi:nitroreductase